MGNLNKVKRKSIANSGTPLFFFSRNSAKQGQFLQKEKTSRRLKKLDRGWTKSDLDNKAA
jgi:hypothetical protein